MLCRQFDGNHRPNEVIARRSSYQSRQVVEGSANASRVHWALLAGEVHLYDLLSFGASGCGNRGGWGFPAAAWGRFGEKNHALHHIAP